ncbi:hypothetical protein CNMCM6805_001084 [Aspergillus fumigatiaffinis]|uniref:GPI anchored protein n=1 Tax=Aspergillus fumigatiaffinis TaxID=340414 RepID=A0A8H4M520_9EURO|nr:hypothetical protein CNMCM5878_001137 [Aspergillus fumigatiaffinis]KAF4229903.1 hypothetical protein CNMCM6805_001084 [Aspergillus fumigatiaffinis]
MRPLQFLALAGLMLASNIALAAELDRDDVPNRCWDVCSPVVGIAQQCDNMHRDDDRAEMNCICDWNQAPTLVPLCEACISQFRNDTRNGTRNDNGRDNDRDDDRDNDRDDDHHDDHDGRRGIHDNDAYDILTSCSFSTTTYNAAAATSILSTATGTITPTATTNAGGSTGSSGNTGNSQSGNTNNSSNAQPNNNAAAGSTVPKAASVAAVVGLIGLAWL